jgi:uncharacterized membrane protein
MDIVIVLAFISSVHRALLNILDRQILGLHKKNLRFTVMVNNLLPLLALSVVLLIAGKLTHIFVYISSFKVFIFSLIYQCVSYSFSYAFSKCKVQQVVLFAKLPDIFIPALLLLIFGIYDIQNILFSVAIFAFCSPFFISQRSSKTQYIAALFLTITLIVQGVFAQFSLSSQISGISEILLYTTAVLFWRFLFTLILNIKNTMKVKDIDFQYSFLVIIRSIVNLITQVTFIFALSQENGYRAWPIINSTIIFSIVLSKLFLKEKTTRVEGIALTGIIGLSLIKMFYN